MEPPPHLTKPRYGAHAAIRALRSVTTQQQPSECPDMPN